MPLFSQQRDPVAPTRRQPQAAPPAGAGATALLKRYRPLETRAAGGFGSVEICLDSRLQRRVAIKRMPLAAPAAGAAHETTATALAEARTASMLQHPNIVQVIDFTYDEAYAYLVMEYVDGMSLEEFLAGVDGHSLTFDEAAAVADALAQALAYAHENGVLHLDIKPANVLIDRSGHVKLTDFGMAALTSSAGFGGARGGTIGYMPPEQLRGEAVDERTDVFALAAVLYECLCADAPFRAGSAADSLRRIERGATPPCELLPDLPEGAQDALMQALSPAPRDRMTGVALLAERFCKRLGNPREGRKSLARIIARLTSDDPETAAAQAPNGGAPRDRAWELDPAEGWLGSQTPRARVWAVGVLGAASVACALWRVLSLLGLTGTAARGVLAAACAVASAAAPQLGSALVMTGFVFAAARGAELLAALPVVIVLTAFLAAWWYVWGRQAAASAVFCLCLALGCALQDAGAGAMVDAALAGFFLAPTAAAATCGLGLLSAQLLAATTAGAGLPWLAAANALADPGLWLVTVGCAAAAALTSLALDRTWERYRTGRGTGFAALACAVPAVAGAAIGGLSAAMEIAGAATMEIADVVGAGIIASIMVFICVYTLGYRRTPEDGD